MKRLARDARDARRRCKVGFTFELRAVPLGIHAAIHPGHVGARRARLRRRTSNLVQVALVTSYSFTRSSCHHGPSWSKCGPGPVSCLQHCWRWRGSTPRWTWCVCRAALRCSSTLRCSEPPPTRTGRPNGLCEERRRGRRSGCAQRPILALAHMLVIVLVTWDAGMARRARQDASGRFCSERSALSLFDLRNPQLISEKMSNFEVV